MEMLTVDKFGRVVIPMRLRKTMGWKAGSRLMASSSQGRLVLERFDAATIARRLHEELKGVDIDKIVREVKAEVHEVARREVEAILAGRKPVRGRNQASTPQDPVDAPAGRSTGKRASRARGQSSAGG